MKRPRRVTIIGSLLLLQGLALLAVAAVLITWANTEHLDMLPQALAAEVQAMTLGEMMFVATALVMGIFGVVSGIGLLRLRPWAWLMAMIVQGIGMIIDLIEYARGRPNYITMTFAVVVVLYLNQGSIQEAFQVARHQTQARRTAAADKRRAGVKEIPRAHLAAHAEERR